jgi:glycyl-tRNA synthetase
MLPLYDVNGLMFWDDRSIALRRQFEDHYARELINSLLEMNPAWRSFRTEGPLLTPLSNINPNYTNEDIWVQEVLDTETPLALRPETTPSSYVYAEYLLSGHAGVKPPFIVWQSGKSFRREQEQPTKHMRLKEFYQQEFQCIFAEDTENDYHSNILEPVRRMISETVALPTRIVESDRLPSYSLKTMDIEVYNSDKWMEVCSISLRKDFTKPATFQTKKGIIQKKLLVLEVAIGLDRCVYNYNQRVL